VRCVPVRESRCRAVVLTVLTVSGCRRGRVVLDWQGPGRWRLDPRVAAAGWLQGRIGHHVFIPPEVTTGAQSPTAFGRLPNVPDRGTESSMVVGTDDGQQLGVAIALNGSPVE